MPLSRRRRFEVLKRDGFRCRYCGTTGDVSTLHVDHVVPISRGGGDDFENLVAACPDCNLGKSNVPLHAVRANLPTDELSRRATQQAAHIDACSKLVRAKSDARDAMARIWRQIRGDGLPRDIGERLESMVETYGIEMVASALEITAKKTDVVEVPCRYMYGVLRHLHKGHGA